jgi:hypothetical protein
VTQENEWPPKAVDQWYEVRARYTPVDKNGAACGPQFGHVLTRVAQRTWANGVHEKYQQDVGKTFCVGGTLCRLDEVTGVFRVQEEKVA